MRRPLPAVAMVQPREIPNEPPPAPSTEPPEPSPIAERGDAGVVGGVEGGTEGGVIGGVVGGQGQQAEREVPDTPTYATAGYRKPELAVQGCLQGQT